MNKVSWMPSGKSSDNNSREKLTGSNVASSDTLPASERAKMLVVKTAITQLFDKEYFDICLLREIMGIIGTRRDGDAYNMLRALHCIPYAKMDPDLRDMVPELVNEALLMCTDNTSVIEVAMKGLTYDSYL